MKRTILVTLLISLTWASATLAQQAPPVAEPAAQKTLAATINVYVFPAEGQTPEQQNREEAECYAWAVNTTKTDPFDLAKQAEQAAQTAEQKKEQVDQSGQGAGAKGALAGAAMGALIGEIASDDAGEGAVYGAAAGAIGARRRARRAKDQAKQQVDQQTQKTRQATAEQIEGFKKAFGVCLEAKKYLVKM